MNRSGKLVVYQDSHGEWRWSLRSGNGRVVADSSEGYAELRKARDAAERLLHIARTARLTVERETPAPAP